MKPTFMLFLFMLSIVIVITELPEKVQGIIVVLHRGRVGRLRLRVKENFRIEKKHKLQLSRSEIRKRLRRPYRKRIPRRVIKDIQPIFLLSSLQVK